MQQASMDDQIHDVLVDCVGLKCPLPVLRARKALKLAAPGSVVRVETTDPMALIDVPHMALEDGHDLVDQQVDGDHAVFLIRCGFASGKP